MTYPRVGEFECVPIDKIEVCDECEEGTNIHGYLCAFCDGEGYTVDQDDQGRGS